jgi:hypothetical protein
MQTVVWFTDTMVRACPAMGRNTAEIVERLSFGSLYNDIVDCSMREGCYREIGILYPGHEVDGGRCLANDSPTCSESARAAVSRYGFQQRIDGSVEAFCWKRWVKFGVLTSALQADPRSLT